MHIYNKISSRLSVIGDRHTFYTRYVPIFPKAHVHKPSYTSNEAGDINIFIEAKAQLDIK